MRQRAMIAMALACSPTVLIADEPTTALDVTIQAQILDIVKRLRDQLGLAIIWITHDLGIIAGLAQRVNVMYGGFIVEEAPVKELYGHPQHPYTLGLIGSLPRLDANTHTRLVSIDGIPPILMQKPTSCPFAPRCHYVVDRCLQENPPLLSVGTHHRAACWVDPRPGDCALRVPTTSLPVDHLVKHFPITKGILVQKQIGAVRAVDDISFDIRRGETLGGGESGCGKSTTGRTILQLYRPTRRVLRGIDLTMLAGSALRPMRPRCNDLPGPVRQPEPRMTVGEIVGEPLVVHKVAARRRSISGWTNCRPGGLERRLRQPLPARILRRPAPAHRCRPLRRSTHR
jgi:oligopeptide/dipeptide ABC transporter ATP-binding protein